MIRIMTGISAIALLATMSACSQTNKPSDNSIATNDMGAANDMSATSDMSATQAAANNPFGPAEMQMDQKMMAAVGANAGDNWVRKMIEHHQGAVDMSRVALAQGVSGDTAKMAQDTIAKQTKEIADLRKLMTEGSPDATSAGLYRPAMMEMKQAMMAAKGSDVADLFMHKMLAHHQGAVAMSDIALANGASGKLRAQIEKTRADQAKEAKMVEGMLRGASMSPKP